MSGRERASLHLSLSVLDRFYRAWGEVAALTGETPKPYHLMLLLQYDDVVTIMRRYRADVVKPSSKTRGRPTLTAFEKKSQQRRAAYAFRDKVNRIAEQNNCDVKTALATLGEPSSTERQYRKAKATIAQFEREASGMILQAAQLTGMSVADVIARIKRNSDAVN
jgi:hypothetical protein